jgi:hypothetical protein
MLSQEEAVQAAQKQFPNRTVSFYLKYRDLYLVTAIDESDPVEGDYDPYYSVNPDTGEIREFSVVTDASRVELTNLWLAQN